MKIRSGLTANCPVFPAEWGSHSPASLGFSRCAPPWREAFVALKRSAKVAALCLLSYGIAVLWGCM